jgi:phosphoglycerate dehydrogenase-like enzyme
VPAPSPCGARIKGTLCILVRDRLQARFKFGLDSFAVEPLPAGSPLRRLENVLLTPHCAGGSIEAVAAMTGCCVDNILAIRDSGALDEDLLNPEALAG